MSSQGSGRRCVFCGADEVTEEHLWSEWIRRILPADWNFRKRWHEIEPRKGKIEETRNWGGPDLDITVTRVCDPCNSRWMSEVENEAKRYLKPLILGERVPLDREAREIVSTWAFLKILMAQFTHPSQLTAPASHYRWLYKERRPPRYGVYIWIAGYLGEEWGGFYRHVPLTTLKRPVGADNRADHLNAYGVTFSIYKLVFQVFGATTAPRGGDLKHVGPLGETTTRIWPNRGQGTVLVPGPLRFDNEGLENFSMIFVDAGGD